MKILNNTIAALLLLSSVTAFAADPLPEAKEIMAALYGVGVREEGMKPVAMMKVGFDENGEEVRDMVVTFSQVAGATTLKAQDITLYEYENKSAIVMTFQAGRGQDAILQKTQIIKVDTDNALVLASVIKENAMPVVNNRSSKPTFTSYSLNNITCSKVVYPGAQPHCSVQP